MSHEIIKNVKVTKDTISFDYTANNVFPQVYRHHEEENNSHNFEEMRRYLIGRIYQPLGSGKRLYKTFGVTHFFDGTPVE